MKNLSVKESSAIIAAMGLIAFISALYYYKDASDINPIPFVFLIVFSFTAYGIVSWVVCSEKRESAQIFLFGVICFCTVPWLTVFHKEITAIILIGVCMISGAYCLGRLFKKKTSHTRFKME